MGIGICFSKKTDVKMLYFSAILLAFFASAAFGTEDSTLWIDDKSQETLYNCDGFVTDAICCQDRICQGQSESSCTSDDKRKLFCAWDSSKNKCLEVRDAKNNVCCQKKPLEGCNDLMKGRCPEQYQVSENCCSEDGKKWNAIFKGVSPGKVCCNAPCKDADFLKCGQLGRCNQRSYSPYLNPYDSGSDTTRKKNSQLEVCTLLCTVPSITKNNLRITRLMRLLSMTLS